MAVSRASWEASRNASSSSLPEDHVSLLEQRPTCDSCPSEAAICMPWPARPHPSCHHRPPHGPAGTQSWPLVSAVTFVDNLYLQPTSPLVIACKLVLIPSQDHAGMPGPRHPDLTNFRQHLVRSSCQKPPGDSNVQLVLKTLSWMTSHVTSTGPHCA